MAQTANMPAEIDPATYTAMFEGRMPAPAAISGVCGRVTRGRSEADFGLLAFASSRWLAWITGLDSLHSIIGCSAENLILRIVKHRAGLLGKLVEAIRWQLSYCLKPRASEPTGMAVSR